MTTQLPTLEKALQDIHLELGLLQGQASIKSRFAQQKMQLDTASEHLENLLGAIFTEIDADEETQKALFFQLAHLASSYTELTSKIWTYNTDSKTVYWYLLGYFFSSGIARQMAFWNLNIEANLDKGMPRGRFWYLPEFVYKKKEDKVYLPVEQVLDWLLDLIDGDANDIAKAYEKSGYKVDIDNSAREVRKWCNGTLPKNYHIKRIFNDNAKLEFKGSLNLEDALELEEKYQKVCQFLTKKGLSEQEIELQLGVKKPNDNSSEEEKEDFIHYALERYQAPSMKTIRTRLILARMVQSAYQKLVKYFCPDVDYKKVTDIHKNKVLQLVEIYKRIYSLTIEAWDVHGQLARLPSGEIGYVETREKEDAYFQQQLLNTEVGAMGIDAMTLYASILPANVALNKSLTETAQIISYMCRNVESTNLPDLLNSPAAMAAKWGYMKEEAINSEDYFKANSKASLGFETALAEVRNFSLLPFFYKQSDDLGFNYAILKRMNVLAKHVFDSDEYHLYQLDFSLNTSMFNQEDAENAIRALKSSENHELFKPFVDYFEAKLALKRGETEALELLEQSIVAFNQVHFGNIQGKIAQEYVGLMLKNSPKNVNKKRYEKYFRMALNQGVLALRKEPYQFEDFKQICLQSVEKPTSLFQQ